MEMVNNAFQSVNGQPVESSPVTASHNDQAMAELQARMAMVKR